MDLLAKPPSHQRTDTDTVLRWLADQPKTILPNSALARRKRDGATGHQSPPRSKRRRPLQPTEANINMSPKPPTRQMRSQSHMRPTRSQSPAKAVNSKDRLNLEAGHQFNFAVAEERAHTRPPRTNEEIQLVEDCSDGEWEDGAIATPRAGRSPDRRGRARTTSPLRPRLTNIPILSSRSSESDYAGTASSTTSRTSSNIITSMHEWQLYFAVDRGDNIEMLRFPGEIGHALSKEGVQAVSCPATTR